MCTTKTIDGDRLHLTSKGTLFFILIPMLATFIGQRLYLHLIHVQHIYPGGYLLHHLFTGTLIVIPSAFILAFGTRNRLLTFLAPAALGIGSAMILDEVVYLVATKATDNDYISPVSLWGATIFISIAVLFLVFLYRSHRD
jgi:hypothetical protein